MKGKNTLIFVLTSILLLSLTAVAFADYIMTGVSSINTYTTSVDGFSYTSTPVTVDTIQVDSYFYRDDTLVDNGYSYASGARYVSAITSALNLPGSQTWDVSAYHYSTLGDIYKISQSYATRSW